MIKNALKLETTFEERRRMLVNVGLSAVDTAPLQRDFARLEALVQSPVPGTAFAIGEAVEKITGDYTFPGHIVAVFTKRSGKILYVVEDDRGVVHIFNEQTLAHRANVEVKAHVPGAGVVEALEKIEHVCDVPEHKRTDTEFLRACSRISRDIASAALAALHPTKEGGDRPARPNFGTISKYHEGMELTCEAIAPGLTLHDLVVAFEEASKEAKPGDEYSGDPSKWPDVRGVDAVAYTLLNAIYGPPPPASPVGEE